MLKNIIFDIGNVILQYNRDFLLRHFYDGKEYELLKEKTFENWELLDRDGLTLEEYNQNVKNSLPPHLSKYAISVLSYWEYYMRYSEGIIPLIQELKQKGYKLFILSNMTRHFINNAYKFPILKEFDGIIYSAPLKIVKPNPEIYQYLLDKYNINASESIYIDDMKTNLAGAARFGMQTFHYQNNTKELRDYILSL